MLPGKIALPVGLLLTGWTVEHPCLLDCNRYRHRIRGALAGTILNFLSIQNYIIDAFTLHAASALAAVFVPPLNRRLWIPVICASYVQCLGIWNGRYDPCCGCYSDRVSRALAVLDIRGYEKAT